MSTCTRRVALIAKELNVPYELKQPPHLQHQPFGQIPYISVRRFALPYLMRRPLMHNSSFFLCNLAR
jgi:hypothetical protein